MEAAVKQAVTIHLRDPPGDILIFMTGECAEGGGRWPEVTQGVTPHTLLLPYPSPRPHMFPLVPHTLRSGGDRGDMLLPGGAFRAHAQQRPDHPGAAAAAHLQYPALRPAGTDRRGEVGDGQGETGGESTLTLGPCMDLSDKI